MLRRLADKPAPPPPTEEQEAIYTHVATTDDNIMVNALAGTGKSHTLEGVQAKSKTKPILYLVFGRKNSDDAKKQMRSTTDVRTFNGQGHRIWFASGRTVKLDWKKTNAQLRELINSAPKSQQRILWAVYDQVVSGVEFAKSVGYIPQGVAGAERSLITQTKFHALLEESPDDLVSDVIDAILRKSIVSAYDGYVDYNDQVYMPALFGGGFPKYPLVMVDEYQDLSPVNHQLLSRLVTDRLIGVGDPWQNIYGFRGATAQGMADAVGTYSMARQDLSISFRCPSAIVEHVHWRVPHFKAFRNGGGVSVPNRLLASDIPDNATVICRNNAPLFAMAFRLIAAGHSVKVAGSDIGPRLTNIMKRLGNPEMNRAQTISAINDWEAEKLANESTTASDMAECMRIFARVADSLSSAMSYAEHLFKQTGSINLLTGHKSKGLEYPYVIHLDPHLLSETEQDLNLRYVISTRSQDQLVEIASSQIQW